MPDAVTFHLRLSPAAHRAERKMHRAGRFLDLPMGSRRWRRWNRVVARNIARLDREVETELRQAYHFVDERAPQWAPGLIQHPATFARREVSRA